MIHYSCDRCKRQIESHEEFRYVVRLEVRAALDVGMEGVDESDDDSLMELHECLLAAEDEDLLLDDDYSQQLRYDLCPECYRQFMRNPLGRDQRLAPKFSNN